MTVTLRDYQLDAIAAIEREHAMHRATLIVLATGLGKTTIFVEWVRRRLAARGGRALVLAHREELIHQAAARVLRQAPELSVGVEQAERRASTLVPEQVVVASVQTLAREARRARFPRDEFHSVVVDEAHHATARSYRAILDHFSAAHVLGVTATPDRGDGVGLHGVFDSCAIERDLLWGIEHGHLCPIRVERVVSDQIDLDSVRVRGGDLDAAELDRLMAVEGVLHQIASPLARLARDRQTIAFLPGVRAAHGLRDVLAGYVGHGRVAAIDGTTPDDERAEILARYQRGDVWCIANCAVLTEGFDAPSTSCVVMARPTRSRALYAQCIGRGTRIAEGKRDLLVLDFAGSSESHSLCSPLDVLGGRPLDDEEAHAARRRVERGQDVVTARREAIAEVAEARAQRAERERRARVIADVQYSTRTVDPWRRIVEGVKETGPRATPAQLAALAKFGVDITEDLSRAQASKLMDEMIGRMKRGLATYRQARWLIAHGYPDTLTRAQASRVMDAWARNGWRRPERDPLAAT